MAKQIRITARTNKIGSECSRVLDFMDDEEYNDILESGRQNEIEDAANEFLIDNMWRIIDIGYEIIDDT